MAKLDETEIKAIIVREIDNSLGLDGTKLTISRRDALKYYEGLPFGNEMAGRSQVVSRDVMEVVEWTLPALLRIFMAGDDVVRFEPQGPEDEAAAKQATEYVNFIFSRDNPGFQIAYNWFKDALLEKNGFVKVYWDKKTEIRTEHYSGLTDFEYQALQTPSDDEEIEIVEEEDYPDPMASMGGQEPAAPISGVLPSPNGADLGATAALHDCVIKRRQKIGKVCIDCVPPEEILITRRATSIETASFVAHRVQKTRTELKEMGFDADLVDQIPVEDEQEYNTERVQRFIPEEEFPFSPLRTDKPEQMVWLIECYIKIDEDGDGLAELRKITVAGSRAQMILDDEEVDEVPLVSICPMPMPHKFFGMSLADMTMDIQLLKSVLWRQTLDNLYLTNNPRHHVVDAPGYANTNTIDDLLLSRPGGIVRSGHPDTVTPLVTPFVADKSMPMIEYVDDVRESRTGVSRRNQGLSPDDLNKTAAGMSMLQQSAAQRVELIARVFAETGMKELFKRILGLVTRHQDRARMIKLRNQWVPMDPRQWRNSFDLSVTVGLGTGNKDQMLTHLMNLAKLQGTIVQFQGGLNGPLITGENVFKTLESLVQNMGFKNAEEFVTDPTNAPAQQPKPDPKMQQQQADMQAKMQQAQMQAQVDQHRAEMDAQTKIQVAQMMGAIQQHIAEMNANTQAQIAQMKADNDARIKAMQFQMESAIRLKEAEIEAETDRMTAQRSDDDIRQPEYGGDGI